MDGPRGLRESEFKSLVEFLNQNLRPGQNWSIQSEYPTALSINNLSNIRIIRDEKQVVSHAVMRPLMIKSPIGFFKVGAIGSVVTDSQFRNQGLSTKILEDCLDLAKAQGCEIAILWTDLYDFYQKLGFTLAGSEVTAEFGKPVTTKTEPLKFIKSSKIDPGALYKIYSSHSVTTVRTLEEFRKYLEIPGSQVYSAWDQHGQIQAFAVEGKGADLQGYVHEWAGGVSKLLALFNHILEDRAGNSFRVIVPGHCEGLIRALTEAPCEIHRGYLGMLKILSFTGLATKIARHARVDFGFSDFVFEKNPEGWAIGSRKNLFVTKNEEALAQLIFGPIEPQELHGFDEKTLFILQKLFPLKFWIWGWDSI